MFKIVPLHSLTAEQEVILAESPPFQQSQCFVSYSASYAHYNQAYFESSTDFSLSFWFKNEVVGLLFANTALPEILSFFGHPVGVFTDFSKLSAFQLDLEQTFVREIQKILAQTGVTQALLPSQSFLLGAFCSATAQIKYSLQAYCDLTVPEEDLLRRMRKSYRSLINWGKCQLEIKILTKENPDRELFLSFKEFHIATAGRKTRSDLSWDRQFAAIQNGAAFLILAYLPEHGLVAGNLVLLAEDEAYYGVGVNNRTLMANKKPIGHWPLVAAIFEAKKLNKKTFNLGKVGPEFATDKEYDIAMFKKGFSNLVRLESQLLAAIDNQRLK